MKNKNNFDINLGIICDVIMHNLLQEHDYMSQDTLYFDKYSEFTNNVSSVSLTSSLRDESVTSWRQLVRNIDTKKVLTAESGEKENKIIAEVIAGTRKSGNIILPIADTIVSHGNNSNPMKKKLQSSPMQSKLYKLKMLLSDADPQELAKGFDEQLLKTNAVHKIDNEAGRVYLKPDKRSKAENTDLGKFDWLKTNQFTSNLNARVGLEIDNNKQTKSGPYSRMLKKQRTDEQLTHSLY